MSEPTTEEHIRAEVARRRTFAIISHPDAGKTTLTEKLLLYAGAMLIDAVSALFFGWLYDRKGIKVLMISTILSSFLAVPIFLFSSVPLTVAGVLLWGVGMGAQESILKAVVTDIVPKNVRSTGFGLFQVSFGVSWFLGSWVMGMLYDFSLLGLVIFSVSTQLLAIPLFGLTDRKWKKEKAAQAG